MVASDIPFLEPTGSDQRSQSREATCWHGELLAGREAGACTVLDISPYGARLLTPIPVAIDLPVTLNLADRGVYFGAVRWHDAGMIGVKFTAGLRGEDRIVTAKPGARAHGAPDRSVDLGARVYEWRAEPRRKDTRQGTLRTGRDCGSCRILDLSPSGARVLAERPLEPGMEAILSIDANGDLGCLVVWAIGEICGLRFEQPDERALQRLIGGT